MAMVNPVNREIVLRRVVLADFDWNDADLLPELLRHPGISVRLMAGVQADDPGVRVAELCGVPRTLELADLTRELFDVALVGERSPRRAHLESLMHALGTPMITPQTFLGTLRGFERRTEVSETIPSGDGDDAGNNTPGDVIAMLDRAIPDLPRAPALVPPPAAWLAELEPVPDSADRIGLERMLARLAARTGAFAAALMVRRGEELSDVATCGGDDPLLRALGDLALRLDSPQVVARMNGTPGRIWGAWPFRTRDQRAVLAAAGLDGREAGDAWERTAFELQFVWARAEQGGGEAEYRFRNRWLTPSEFRSRVRLAVDRHRRERGRFALHRLHFSAAAGLVEVLCQRLPDHLRAADCLCLPSPGVVLVLCAGPAAEFPHVQHRIEELWAKCCAESGAAAPPIADERIELVSDQDAEVFIAAAAGWLATR